MQNESKPSRGYWFAQFGLAFGFIAAGIKIALVLKAEALPFLLLIGMVAFGTLYYVRLRWRGIKKNSTGHGGPWVCFAGALIFAYGALSGVHDLFKPGWSWADVILIVLSSAVAVWSFRLGLKERQTLHNTTNPVDKNS